MSLRKPHFTSSRLECLLDFLNMLRSSSSAPSSIMNLQFETLDDFFSCYLNSDIFAVVMNRIHEWWLQQKSNSKNKHFITLFQLIHQLEHYKGQVNKKRKNDRAQEEQQEQERVNNINKKTRKDDNNDETLINQDDVSSSFTREEDISEIKLDDLLCNSPFLSPLFVDDEDDTVRDLLVSS